MSSYVTSSGTSVGILSSGFVIERQSDIILDLQQAWKAAFGANVNLAGNSNNGQIIGIVSERMALLWELLEAIYNSQYPNGAEGTSVDNILALNGLTRQAASFGHTNTSPLVLGNGITLYGLICTGVAGTTVPRGSRIGDSQTPQNVFVTDGDIYIAPAANAVQTLVMSGVPTQGSFALSIVDTSSNTLTTPAIPFSASAAAFQSAIAGLYDASGKVYPYTDVMVSANGQVYTITFGGSTPAAGQPSSAAQPQPLMTVANNSLQASGTYINLTVSDTIQGQPAQGVGSATAAVTGPLSVLAGTLTQILTPLSGWTGVTNQLDCITGTDVETDEQALLRRSQLLSVQARGPLLAILQAVQSVDGVTSALAFQNLTNAAQQVLSFGSVPSSGSYQLVVGGNTTAAIPAQASSATVQAAINALPGYTAAIVTGTYVYGFTIDWAGSNGGQAVPLMQVVNSTAGVPVSVQYGRPPKSVEVVAQGGSPQDIAKAIYTQALAGLSTYAAPVAQTNGTVTAGSPTMSVTSVTNVTVGLSILGYGVAPGTTVSGISGNNITMSQAAISSYSNTPVLFNWSQLISDINGNPIVVGFSRPVEVAIYVVLQLVTDSFNTPGQPSSGANPSAQFNPASIPQIQADLVAIANSVPVGGRLVVFGSSGLVGAFNSIQGIVDYQLLVGPTPNPTQSKTLQFLAEQQPYLQAANILVQIS